MHAQEKRLDLVRSTGLKKLSRTPAHFKAWVEESDEDKPAYVFGRALHCATLEPERFDKEYACEPAFGDCRNKDNKATRDAWRADHEGHQLISAVDWSKVMRMREALRAHPFLAKILPYAYFEWTVTVKEPGTSLTSQATFDIIVPSRGVAIDLKTMEDASPRGVEKAIGNYGYALQEAHYRKVAELYGVPLKAFPFLPIEKEAPFCIGSPGGLDEDSLTWAYAERERLVMLQTQCVESGEWPGYDTHLTTYKVPVWARG